jgi:hypothetical protein
MLLRWNDVREILVSGVGVKLGDVLEGQWGTDMDPLPMFQIISDPTICKSVVANGVNIQLMSSHSRTRSQVPTHPQAKLLTFLPYLLRKRIAYDTSEKISPS